MTVIAYNSGNQITYDQKSGRWLHKDGSEAKITKCKRCGELPTSAGHDSCIANLPGVANACCGHGIHPGYVQFNDGTIIRGKFTVERKLKKG